MKARQSLLLLAGLLALASPMRAAEDVASPERKIIYYGWNSPDTMQVRENWQAMEKMPFDGIGLRVAIDRTRRTDGDGSTGNLLGWQVFGPVAFSPAQFKPALADLQVPRWTTFTDNFLAVAAATRDQDAGLNWFDDARWKTIEGNWRILIRLARDGKCRGILLDPEHYDYECELFSYANHHAQRHAAPFPEYAAKARERGVQLGAVLRTEFPAIVVGLLYGYTLPALDARGNRRLETTRYALLPSFLDGLLSASAPEATFVDLYEFGHGFTAREDFENAAQLIRSEPPPLTGEPELYRNMVRAGSSVRIDFAAPGKSWDPLRPDRNHFSPPAFRKSLQHALRSSDRYVWIYSEENPRFFPPENLPASYVTAIEEARRFRPDGADNLGAIGLGLAAFVLVGILGLKRFFGGSLA